MRDGEVGIVASAKEPTDMLDTPTGGLKVRDEYMSLHFETSSVEPRYSAFQGTSQNYAL